ncbi:MAG: hypothetical protein ACLU4N_13785 [Butyricimonas faecihominis]
MLVSVIDSGADYFNSELHNRIENITKFSEYNQDKRALYDRWQKVGIMPIPEDYFKVAANETPDIETVYVQRENAISGKVFRLPMSLVVRNG